MPQPTDFFTHTAPDAGEEGSISGPPGTSIADKLRRAALLMSMTTQNLWRDPVHTLIPWTRALARSRRGSQLLPATQLAAARAWRRSHRRAQTTGQQGSTLARTTCSTTISCRATPQGRTGRTRFGRIPWRVCWGQWRSLRRSSPSLRRAFDAGRHAPRRQGAADRRHASG